MRIEGALMRLPAQQQPKANLPNLRLQGVPGGFGAAPLATEGLVARAPTATRRLTTETVVFLSPWPPVGSCTIWLQSC